MQQRDDEKLKKTLAENLIHYRKECSLTQDELAELIFYSGKSVSKWERGEGIPDICVLAALADIFGVTVNDLISEKRRKRRFAHPQLKRNIITFMSLALVFLIAAIAFFFIKIFMPELDGAWMAFVIAVPVMFIVAIVLTALWHTPLIHFACISGLVWSLSITLRLLFRIKNMSLIYIIAAALQLLIVLWYLLVNTQLFASISSAKLVRGLKGDRASSGRNTPNDEQK